MPIQRTLGKAISYEGVGLHSGKPVCMTIKPGEDNSGIVFVRTDLPNNPRIAAHITNVVDTRRATTLSSGEAKVHTAEHVLAAFSALGVHNAEIELDSSEPPVGDGSAQVFVELIRQAGVVQGKAKTKVLSITQPIWVTHEDKYVVALPSDCFRISFIFTNPHRLIGTQYAEYTIDAQSFCQHIAPARTIGFMHEVEALKELGLGLGGSLDNAVVFDDESCLSELRFADEPVRHKILDVIGDIALLGPLKAHIIAVKSSHALNAELSNRIYRSVHS